MGFIQPIAVHRVGAGPPVGRIGVVRNPKHSQRRGGCLQPLDLQQTGVTFGSKNQGVSAPLLRNAYHPCVLLPLRLTLHNVEQDFVSFVYLLPLYAVCCTLY